MSKNFTLLAFLCSLIFASCSFSQKDSTVEFNDGKNSGAMVALNRQSVDGKITKPRKGLNHLSFMFTPEQKEAIGLALRNNGSCGIKVDFSADRKFAEQYKNEDFFSCGFFYCGEPYEETLSRHFVHGNLFSSPADRFSVVCSIGRGTVAPDGFSVFCEAPCSVTGISLSDAAFGVSRENDEWTFYAAPSDSPVWVSWNLDEIDFSDAGSMFGNENYLPALRIVASLSSPGLSDGKALEFNYGTEKFRCTLFGKETDEIEIPLKGVSSPFSEMKCADSSRILSAKICFPKYAECREIENGRFFPIETDLGLILDWPREKWRVNEFEFFRWRTDSNVFYFDFDNYRTQNLFFTRLAYFVEKTGYVGTLVDDWIVDNKHGYNAHDYKADDLAAFFNCADRENFRLNSHELLLKQILIDNEIIIPTADGTYRGNDEGGMRSVLSISRESAPYLRWTFVAHEAWHGLFFSRKDFRDFTNKLFNQFDPLSRDFLIGYWSSQPTLNYDTSNDYLIKNEFMAYMMQQPVSKIREYFNMRADWNSVRKYQDELCDYIKETDSAYFEAMAEKFNRFAKENWGLSCGRVHRILRLTE